MYELAPQNQRPSPKDLYNWQKNARPEQLPPKTPWETWLILAGRGFGKTRVGAETIRIWVESGQCRRIALIGETAADTRHVMVEGESGLMSIFPDHNRPKYEPSKRTLTWPNGAIATCFSGDRYDQLRGPQFDGAWIDEFAKFQTPEKTWDQLMFSLRLGQNPRAIITTTPRPIPILTQLIKTKGVHVTRGSTFDNKNNLSAKFLARVKERYEGTTLGAQELFGKIVTDRQGALWTHKRLDQQRVRTLPTLNRIVVAIDPAVSCGENADETGIVVTGKDIMGHCYVLEDLSGKYPPLTWAKLAVEAYHRYKADRIIAEVNNGGDLVESTLRAFDTSVSYKAVRASRGKLTRAEPVAALYEKGKVFHVKTGLEKLEKQMLDYAPGQQSKIKSPDRVDALVWGITELALSTAPSSVPRVYTYH